MPASIFDKVKMPPAAALLDGRLIDVDIEHRQITVGFDIKPEFLKPSGHVQGGILAAMLEHGIDPIVVALTEAEFVTTTVDLHISYMRPVEPGPVSVIGQITNMAKQIAYLEARLLDASGRLCARATASCLLMSSAPRRLS